MVAESEKSKSKISTLRAERRTRIFIDAQSDRCDGRTMRLRFWLTDEPNDAICQRRLKRVRLAGTKVPHVSSSSVRAQASLES